MGNIMQKKAELGVETAGITHTFSFYFLTKRGDANLPMVFGLKVSRLMTQSSTRVFLVVPVYSVVMDCLEGTSGDITEDKVLSFGNYIRRYIQHAGGALDHEENNILINVSSDFSGVDAETFVWTEHAEKIKKQIQKVLETYEWFHGVVLDWMSGIDPKDSAEEDKNYGKH